MPAWISIAGGRLRTILSRLGQRLGLQPDSYLVILAAMIGVIAAAAAVAFHESIDGIRRLLYNHIDPLFLYGKGVWLIVLLPMAGGLVVGLIARYIIRGREGHGVVDVIESVIRAEGFVKPFSAIERIVTSAITIGSGGSAGAEGPIVQIGAAIASGIGRAFRVARSQMPLLIGCGSAAGISAIFNAPIGGVLFTMEVILQEFSLRSFTPVVIASVIANVTTMGIFQQILHRPDYDAIFAVQVADVVSQREITWGQITNFALLGLLCGVMGVMLTRSMVLVENRFARLPLGRVWRPAIGGGILGVTGLLYVICFGWFLLGQPKPFQFTDYPMPAFFGDGYGVIRQLLSIGFYETHASATLLLLLAFLCVAKIFGTCVTLGSGGSGGIIAPSVFLGAAAGGLLGILFRQTGWFYQVNPNLYALVGMGEVLAAVVHAPLASILIVFELTHDHKVILPAMLACVLATGVARLLFRDSIYTLGLRARGIQAGSLKDLSLLRRLAVENITLEPVTTVRPTDPLQRLVELISNSDLTDFIVIDRSGNYAGMVTQDELHKAMVDHEALPLLLVSEVMRTGIPMVRTTDDLAKALDVFSLHDVESLPVCVADGGKVIGLLTRSRLMTAYQKALAS